MTKHGSFHRFSPREQNLSPNSPSSSHRHSPSSAARPWDGQSYDQNEIFVDVSSPRSLSKKQQSSPQYSHSQNHIWTKTNSSRGTLMVMNDRHRQPSEKLANSKQQWNAQRDVSSGTVRNNPFLPKWDQSQQLLVHRKNQWDTADIPQGSVSSKTLLINNAEEMLDKGRYPSPRRTQHFQQRRSYASSGRDDTEVRMYPSSPRIPAPTSPVSRTMTQQIANDIGQQKGQSPLSGRFDSTRPSPTTIMGSLRNQFHDKPTVQQVDEERQLSPMPRSVPKKVLHDDRATGYASSGTTLDLERNQSERGKISSPFHQQKMSPVHHESEHFTSWKPSQEIPKGTVKGRVATLFGGANIVDGDLRQVFRGTRQIMRETMDADPWSIPSKSTPGISTSNWGQTLQARSNDSEEWENPNTDWLQQPNMEINAKAKSAFLESAKDNKSKQVSSLFDRKMDVFKTASTKEKSLDAFDGQQHSANDRDMEILMAAKTKNHGSSQILDVSDHGHLVSSTAFHDAEFERQAFPDNDAFGSSFVDFQEAQVNEGVVIHSTENSYVHYSLQGEDQLERIFQDVPQSQKNLLLAGSQLELAVTSGAESQKTIDATAGGQIVNMKHSVIKQPYSEVDEHESTNLDLGNLTVGGSEDSDSDGSRELLNKLETKRHSRILRPGADRKRKTEKLRRYGEVNSRFKEHSSQGTGAPKLNVPYPRTLKNSRYTKEVQDRGSHYDAKPTKGSRHAKIKYNITGTKLAKRNELEDVPSTRTRRSKARNYARQRAGYVDDDFMHLTSSESAESVTLASVGSDIRALRSILRRPRRSVSALTSQSKGEFPTFEEAKLDPMQESGLKMLSATIIPMQAQVRRFLAMRRALTRMWALIVIQAHTRRWIAEKHYKNTLQSAIVIQAVVRGHLARDDLDFKHVCAIEIQRVMRGYMSTMKVYEDIYKITVIQSYVRMKQVMDKASWKMAHIVQLQSVFRGFLVRRRQEYQQICAIAIQANWRRFYHRLNYQFDLLDIIIVQSVWRKKIAKRKLESIRQGRLDKAAAVIQSKWRQILYSAIYIQDMANILVAQSALRRYLARKRARLIRDYWVIPAQAYARGYLGRRALEKHRAARKIQSSWRGFVGYADYMFSIADIVNVQKVARAWLARREANHTRKLNMAATTIQSSCRVILSKALVGHVVEVREMERRSRELAHREARAATSIQSAVRRMQTQLAYIAFMASRKIQTFWRCRNLSNAYKYYRAAMTIQSSFRGMKTRQETLILRGEILAATIIQSAWRGFVSYTDYIFTVSDIITVQRAFRGHMARKTKDGAIVHKTIQKRRRITAAATTIQKGCRGLLDRQRYWYTLGCTMQIQSWMRGRLVVLQLRKEEKARVKLQSCARRFLARQEYVQKKFIFMLIQTAEQERSKKIESLIVQEKARNDIDEKRRHNAACTIQRFFVSVREEVDQLVRAARRRKNWRKKNFNRERLENGNDELLEDAWLDVACDSNLENDSSLAQTHVAVGSDLRVEENCSPEYCNNKNQKVPRKDNRAVKRNLLPPSKSTAAALNEFSKLTGYETAFYRLPQARTKRMDSREMSDDLELEEAFMDTKIFNAKHRRIANKKRNYKI